MRQPTIHLFADVLGGFGGIETYLDALARRLARDGWPLKITVSLNEAAPFLNALEDLGVSVYRQPRVPGDRWQVRQRLLVCRVAAGLKPGDWVYCVREPMPEIYLSLVRAVHRRGGKVAASWMFAPEFLPPPPGRAGQGFNQAVAETDAVISVAECTKGQFKAMYGYDGRVEVVRYHNIEIFPATVPLPPSPPYQFGFLGRIDIRQKNLDTILAAMEIVMRRRDDVVLNVHGGGPDLGRVAEMVAGIGLAKRVTLHGRYDHRRDLPEIVARNHAFIYTSRFEGGPCFSLLELLQAGRFVVTSPVGGIPDIYDGRPGIGELVRSDCAEDIADALERTVQRIADDTIEPRYIRSIYSTHFHEDVAHQQWLSALGLGASASPVVSRATTGSVA